MYDNFNYEESLNKIKASLFDIYENQEKVVGNIEDEVERNNHVSSYIEVKNIAVELIEKIENLYINPTKISINNDVNVDTFDVEQDSENVQINEADTEESEDNTEEDKNDFEQVEEEIKPDLSDNEENNDIPQIIPIDNEDEQKEVSEEVIDNVEDETSLNEFYLDDRNGTKANFAYVPKNIFLKLKDNSATQEQSNDDVLDNLFYKDDTNSPKGIIVRTDQYMKLSLSKHRQEGVLREAKQFRINEAKKAREKLRMMDEVTS